MEALNRAIAELKSEGVVGRLVRRQFYPTLSQAVSDSALFRWIAVFATLTASVSGVLLAHRERYDIIGAFALASAPSVGGGVLRDLIAGRIPVGIMRDPLSIYAIVFVVIGGFIFFRIRNLLPGKIVEDVEDGFETMPLVDLFDTLGLAGFTVIGVLVAVEMRCEPLWLWGPILAAVTNGGGSLIRDVIRRDASMSVIRGSFFPEVALIWGFLFSVYMVWYSFNPPFSVEQLTLATFAAMGGAMLTRFAAIRWRWRSPNY
jgi:polar amino acid transport system substrate-binding protein